MTPASAPVRRLASWMACLAVVAALHFALHPAYHPVPEANPECMLCHLHGKGEEPHPPDIGSVLAVTVEFLRPAPEAPTPLPRNGLIPRPRPRGPPPAAA